jgi:hypothetical protein
MQARWQKQRNRLAYLAIAGLLLLNSGCLLAVAGAGAVAGGAGYAYYKGNVCREYPADFADVWAATQAALGDLRLPIESAEQGSGEGTFYSRTCDGDRVKVQVETQPGRAPAEGSMTRVGVRVATFGDEPFSQRLLEQVGLHLVPAAPMGPPVPAVPPPLTPAAARTPPETAPPPLLPPEPVPAAPPAAKPD